MIIHFKQIWFCLAEHLFEAKFRAPLSALYYPHPVLSPGHSIDLPYSWRVLLFTSDNLQCSCTRTMAAILLFAGGALILLLISPLYPTPSKLSNHLSYLFNAPSPPSSAIHHPTSTADYSPHKIQHCLFLLNKLKRIHAFRDRLGGWWRVVICGSWLRVS